MTPLARSAGLPPKGADGIGGDASRDFPQRGQTESAEALRVAFSEVADGIGGDAPRGFLRSGRRNRRRRSAWLSPKWQTESADALCYPLANEGIFCAKNGS